MAGIIVNKEKTQRYLINASTELTFNGWSWHLTLGDEVYISSEELPRRLKKREPVTIKSGDFGLLITEEEICLPRNVMAFISMRFAYKKKGLINVSGFHVDPGYDGKLIFSVYNAGPNDVVLKRGDEVFMIFFEEMMGYCDEKRPKAKEDIPSDVISEIRGVSTSLANNAARIDKLDFYFKITLSTVIALFTIVVGAILAKVW